LERITPSIILATDCGSTTTKARLFQKIGEEYRFICAGEAPTTVEAPYEDVTMGVRNAVREVEELSGHKFLAEEGIMLRKRSEEWGADLYVTTSSAGGGLQMMVFGATKSITGESAERAALGGGAIVMDIIASSDNVPLYRKIERTRNLRPDMVLIAGGTDGGSVAPVVQAAEIMRVAEPKARFGSEFSLPVIFAGNLNARDAVKNTLGDIYALKIVDNIRPSVESENSDPARDAIQELFMEHVMSHAPGYDKLMTWTDIPIMPTPRGEGTMFQTVARIQRVNVIGVGLGGATTNIYSVYDNKFVRTVSANLGMSYSICNVLREAGIENILRWIPFDVETRFLVNILRDKMIRPTTIPQTLEELVIEHAVAREALRLGFYHHKFLARGLRGVRPAADLSKIFWRKVNLETYIDMLNVHLIGGTGGLLSHAPRRVQSALILIDGFQPEGITQLIQDSVFMFPHLGVLSTVYPKVAYEIFDKDAVVRLGYCISPRGPVIYEDKGETAEGVVTEELMNVEVTMPDGTVRTESLDLGEIRHLPLGLGEFVEVKVNPHERCDMGAGLGKTVTAKIEGGAAGIIIDARGRPTIIPEERDKQKRTLLSWLKTLNAYPETFFKRCEEE
jgi:uncharacterized protein (TIGR01319 family)